MTNLAFLRLNDNRLTNLTLSAGLSQLSLLHLTGNQLCNISLPAGLTNLTTLNLMQNQLTTLTLPPDITQLSSLFIEGNPLTNFVLSEPLAATGLAGVAPGNCLTPISPLTRSVRSCPISGGYTTCKGTFGNGAKIGMPHCQAEFKSIRPRPPGPVQLEDKVMRGGAYDYPDSSCRSASRLYNTPFHADTDLGFRVVLATEP